jgi:beta-glucosidase
MISDGVLLYLPINLRALGAVMTKVHQYGIIFVRQPSRIRFEHNPDVSCNTYEHYSQDVILLKKIGINSLRFSISWPRIQPNGSSKPNPTGVDFYKRYIDCLLENGISPLAASYHWHLPQILEDMGGWLATNTVHRFAEYAEHCAREFGDRSRT